MTLYKLFIRAGRPRRCKMKTGKPFALAMGLALVLGSLCVTSQAAETNDIYGMGNPLTMPDQMPAIRSLSDKQDLALSIALGNISDGDGTVGESMIGFGGGSFDGVNSLAVKFKTRPTSHIAFSANVFTMDTTDNKAVGMGAGVSWFF